MKLGILGMGFMGRTHYEAARRIPGVQVTAVADTNSALVPAGDFPDVRIHHDAASLLADRDLEAVVVCLPTFLHEQAVLDAAAAGKHILCEKPFTLSVASASRMKEAAQTAGVALMIAQPLRFWPEYLALRDAIRNGSVGKPRTVVGWRLSSMPGWSNWFRNPALSGGCLLDLHIHDLDFTYWLFGCPESVYTTGVRSNDGAWTHILNTLSYEHTVVNLEASYDLPASWPFSMGLRVNGTAGCVDFRFQVSGNVDERQAARSGVRLYPVEGPASDIKFLRGDAYVEQLKYFAETVSTGGPLTVCPVHESLAVMQLYEACARSAASGTPVSLESQQQLQDLKC